MNLARADTYINVYLPREDGEDPRKYVQHDSPVFEEDTIYKFSDEIVKDRKLFLGRKQLSLYEIYYKESPDLVNNHDGAKRNHTGSEHDDNDGDEIENLKKRLVELPSINKVSLDLESKIVRRVKRSGGMHRFNEPLNTYVANKKKAQVINRYEPAESLDRQTTSLDFLNAPLPKKDGALLDSLSRSVTMHRFLKKTQSAPVESRHIRNLGLPPIYVSKSRPQTTLLKVTPASTRQTTRILPVRPETKQHRSWRQTNNMVMEKFTPKLITRVRPTLPHSNKLHVGSRLPHS